MEHPFVNLPLYLPWRYAWPVYVGAVVGLVRVALVAWRGRGGRVAGGSGHRSGAVGWTASALVWSSVGAFVGLLWVRDSYRPAGFSGTVSHLAGMWTREAQFLSNEQLTMFATMWFLAWALPAITVAAGIVAACTRLSRPGGSAGSR